jgi:hypothetical protein
VTLSVDAPKGCWEIIEVRIAAPLGDRAVSDVTGRRPLVLRERSLPVPTYPADLIPVAAYPTPVLNAPRPNWTLRYESVDATRPGVEVGASYFGDTPEAQQLVWQQFTRIDTITASGHPDVALVRAPDATLSAMYESADGWIVEIAAVARDGSRVDIGEAEIRRIITELRWPA